jgi:hypothetical protein
MVFLLYLFNLQTLLAAILKMRAVGLAFTRPRLILTARNPASFIIFGLRRCQDALIYRNLQLQKRAKKRDRAALKAGQKPCFP